jgi:hypothetical protein
MPPEPSVDGHSVPQADSLPKVRELVHAVAARSQTSIRDAGLAAGLSTRHAGYYGRAAEILGLLEPANGRFRLTELGRKLLAAKAHSENERVILRDAIKGSTVISAVAPSLLDPTVPDRQALTEQIQHATQLAYTTAHRRAGSLLVWRAYILDPRNDDLPGLDKLAPARRPATTKHGSFIEVANFGPIANARVDFGDLTVLVGPQATGKSLLLQLWKLAVDRSFLIPDLRRKGLVIETPNDMLDVYLGEGMSAAWSEKTKISTSHGELSMSNIHTMKGPRERATENVYFVPAHRSLLITDAGWPLRFQQLPNAPVVARSFGERLALELGSSDADLFPQPRQLKAALRAAVDEAVFHGARLELDAPGRQKQMRLKYGEKANLGYMSWTAGQREFVPLLLGLYPLLPSSAKAKDNSIEWVIVEEPEMGLHPQAILSVLLLLLELIDRGYRVAVTTHAPIVLDIIWGLQELQKLAQAGAEVRAVGLFREMFDLKAEQAVNSMAISILSKSFKVFSLTHTDSGSTSRDITDLDPGSADPAVAGWGGLSGLSARIAEAVGKAIQEMDTQSEANSE